MWIPCDVRMPENESDYYLVSGRMRFQGEIEYEYFVDVAKYLGEKSSSWLDGTYPLGNTGGTEWETWNDWYEGQNEYEIVAWQPLPTPYQEKHLMATIQVDTREKQRAIQNILKTFEQYDINYIQSKMYVGDYCLLENPLCIIDRKQNIAEIAHNATTGHGRMKRELKRLDDMNGQMTFLIEQKTYTDPNGTKRTLNSLEDIMYWENPHGCVDGIQVYKILDAWQHKHNISYRFCDKRTTGKVILEILNRGMETKQIMEKRNEAFR